MEIEVFKNLAISATAPVVTEVDSEPFDTDGLDSLFVTAQLTAQSGSIQQLHIQWQTGDSLSSWTAPTVVISMTPTAPEYFTNEVNNSVVGRFARFRVRLEATALSSAQALVSVTANAVRK